jgi:hypothetical protein
MGNYTDLPPQERPGYLPQTASFAHPATTAAAPSSGITYAQPGHVQYAPTTNNFAYTAAPASQPAPTRNPAATTTTSGGFQYANPPSGITYTSKPVSTSQPPTVRHNAQPMSTSYPPPPMQPQYTAMPQAPPPPPASQPAYPPPPMGQHSPGPEHHRAASQSAPMSTHDGRNVVELRPHGHYPDRADGLRMDRLSVSGNSNRPDLQPIVPGGMPGGFPGGLPPPSPLLEAYHGTYQSISPMPQAMMLDDDLDHLPPLDSLSLQPSNHAGQGRLRAHSASRRSPSPSRSKRTDKLALEAYGRSERLPEKEKRRARVYDATDDALALVDAMAARTPNLDTIIDILPLLSHDQMLELRAEYKRHCKVQGRGINIAKHIKLKTSGNFGKIAYVTALGKYEGEGYWANYWYQSNSARRELLVSNYPPALNKQLN